VRIVQILFTIFVQCAYLKSELRHVFHGFPVLISEEIEATIRANERKGNRQYRNVEHPIHHNKKESGDNMKIRNVEQLNDFKAAVEACSGQVWLESPEGDKFNLKSSFSQYIAFGNLLSEQGSNLELFCAIKEEEVNFLKFFKQHPEVMD